MAVQATPSFIQAGSEAAEDVRRLIWALVGQRGGIINAADLAVTQNGTPNMSVNVATGNVLVPGSEAVYQGVYFGENRGTLNLAVSAADATNGRRDLVVARIRDAAYATGPSNSFAIEIITGTPAASPADPTVPANCWVLARLTVAATVTTIVTGNITDLRTSYGLQGRATALGGIMSNLASAAVPPNVDVGDMIYNYDTKLLYAYNGSTWDLLSAVPTAWTAPTLLNSWVNYGAGNVDAAYRKVGDIVYLRGQVKNGTTAAGTSILTLPVGFRPTAQVVVPTLDGNNALGRFDITAAGAVIIQVGANNAFGINAQFSTL